MISFKEWWFYYTPQSPGYDTRWLAGLYWRYTHIRSQLPLLTLTAPWWWRSVMRDVREGKCKQCDACNRSWFSFRILPAIVGGKFIPPCGR